MATAALIRSLTGGSTDPVVVAALAGWSDERLETLLVARPELTDSPPWDFEDLALRAALGPFVDACHGRLDQWCIQVADAVCLLGDSPTTDGLRELLGLPVDQADLDAALLRLEDLALVFRTGPDLHPVDGFEDLRFPAGLGPPVEEMLARRSAGDLGTMARRLGAEPGGTKPTSLATLARALADPMVVLGVVEAGPKGTVALAEALGRFGAVTVAGGTNWMPENTPAGWLANRGLAVSVSYNVVVMPRQAGLALRGGRPYPELAPRPPAVVQLPVEQAAVDAAAAERALALVADVATVLDGFSEAPPKILKAGGVGIRDVRRVAKAIGRSETDAAVLIELAGTAGLAAADRATDTALPLPAYDEWLGLEAPQRWAALVAAWIGSEVHLSVAGALDTKEKPIPPLLGRQPDPGATAQRRLLMTAMAETPEGISPDRPGLCRRAAWAGPRMWRGEVPQARLAGWVMAEADILGVCGLGGLSTAGRRAVVGDIGGAAHALSPFAPTLVDHFVVQADLSAMAPGELAPPVRAELELVADVESTGAAAVYRFSEASVRRGFAAGRTADEITAFLEAHASRGVPQPLAYLVADLGRRHGRLRVGRARCYLRSDDPSLLAEVRRGRRTAALDLRELAPTVLVTDAEPGAILAALLAAGYPAAEEDAAGALVLTRATPRRAAAPVARRRPGLDYYDDDDDLDLLLAALADPASLATLAAGPAGAGADPGTSAAASIVAALREAAAAPPPPAPPAPPRGPTRPRRAPELFGFDDGDGDCSCDECAEISRPTTIARKPHALLDLLESACADQWLVRLAYEGPGNREMQVTAAVIDVGLGVVDLECLPRWDARSLPFSQLRWARVLTDTEEGVLL